MFVIQSALAESNKSEVIQTRESHGWRVAWGNEIDHARQIEFVGRVSAAAACAAGSAGSAVLACIQPLKAFVMTDITAQARALTQQAKDLAYEDAVKFILESLNDDSIRRVGNLEIHADLATYNY